MPLTLDYRKILNWETLCYVGDPDSGKRVEHPFNFAMGLVLMQTGFNSITHKNAERIYERTKLFEVCCGPFYNNGDGTPRYITPEDVRNYVGLGSNCTVRSDAWFYKRLREELAPDLRRTYRSYAERQEENVVLVEAADGERAYSAYPDDGERVVEG